MELLAKAVLCLCLACSWAETQEQKPFGETQAWEDFHLECPGKQGVNGLTLQSVTDNVRQWVDFTFKIYCRPFVPEDEESQDDGEEKCRNSKVINFGQEELLYEDKERNCDCNEYVKGIIGTAGREKQWTGWDPNPATRPYRETWSRQFRMKCCTKKNNYIDIQTCGYVGPKNLYHPHGVHLLSLDGTEGLGGVYATGKEHDDDNKPKEFLMGLSTTVDDIIAGYCTFAVLNFHPEAKKLKKKIKNGYCDFFMIRSMMEEYDKKTKCEDWALHGWPRPFTSSNNDVLWVHGNSSDAGNLLFRTQETVCRDGNQIRSFHKYARRDPRSGKKDYVFLTQCMDFEGQACICEWNTTCDEKHWAENPDCSNETAPRCSKYIAGFRSSWNKDMDRREIELFCCISTGMKLVECNLTKVQEDHDVQVVLPYPRFSQFDGGLGDARGFRDIRVQWEGENMYVQYDVCRWNASDFPPCSYPCFPQFAMNFTTATQISTTTAPKCPAKYDLMIILDNSDSIEDNGVGNFASMKTFLRQLVSKFYIGQTETRVGIYKFGAPQTSVLEWDLLSPKTDSLSNLDTAIGVGNNDGVILQGGSTCIICGFNGAKAVFANPVFLRPGVPQVALLVTDGKSNQPPTVSPAGNIAAQNAAALSLRQASSAGVSLFALGISDEPDQNSLVGYVGGDASKVTLVRGKDYSKLNTVVDQIATQICESSTIG